MKTNFQEINIGDKFTFCNIPGRMFSVVYGPVYCGPEEYYLIECLNEKPDALRGKGNFANMSFLYPELCDDENFLKIFKDAESRDHYICHTQKLYLVNKEITTLIKD
jgi:hypothetical protein